MPNWCDFSIDFMGKPEDIEQLDKSFMVPEGEIDPDDAYRDYDLTRALPIPEELRITSTYISLDEVNENPEYEELRHKYIANLEKYGYKDWYDWCIDNWGTKWAPEISDIDNFDNGHMSVRGMSAWGPPDRLVQHITSLYPVDAYVSYQETGMCFAGVDAYRGGEQVYRGYFDFSDVPAIGEAYDIVEQDLDGDGWQKYYDAIEDAMSVREVAAMAVMSATQKENN